MELRFISKEEEKEVTRRGRRDRYPWEEAIAVLATRPNEWAELPFTVVFPASVEVVKRRYKNIRFICRDGNMKRKGDPDKKNWRVFARLEKDN